MSLIQQLGSDKLWELIIALCAGGGIGSMVSARLAARRNNLDELRGIIAEQRAYIDQLEKRVDALTERVRELECGQLGARSGARGRSRE